MSNSKIKWFIGVLIFTFVFICIGKLYFHFVGKLNSPKSSFLLQNELDSLFVINESFSEIISNQNLNLTSRTKHLLGQDFDTAKNILSNSKLLRKIDGNYYFKVNIENSDSSRHAILMFDKINNGLIVKLQTNKLKEFFENKVSKSTKFEIIEEWVATIEKQKQFQIEELKSINTVVENKVKPIETEPKKIESLKPLPVEKNKVQTENKKLPEKKKDEQVPTKTIEQIKKVDEIPIKKTNEKQPEISVYLKSAISKPGNIVKGVLIYNNITTNYICYNCSISEFKLNSINKFKVVKDGDPIEIKP